MSAEQPKLYKELLRRGNRVPHGRRRNEGAEVTG